MRKIFLYISFTLLILTFFSVLCFAEGNAAPSVTSKLAPDVIEKEVVINGENIKVSADIVSSDGSIMYRISSQSFFVTAYANRNAGQPLLTESKNTEIKNNLEKVYNDVISAKKLGDIVPELEELAKKDDPSYTSLIYVVKDIFDIAATENCEEIYRSDDAYVEVTFDLGLTDSSEIPMILLYNGTEDKYTVISESSIERNEDNTVTVRFPELGEVMVVKKDVTRMGSEGDESRGVLIIIMAAISVSCILTVIIMMYKRRKNQN